MFSKRLFKRNKKINGKGAKIMIKKRNENDNKFSEFIEKYKTDEKYRAKTKLIGYGIFIAILILIVDIASINSSSSENIISLNKEKNSETNEKEVLTEENLLNRINDNYEYIIQIHLSKENEEDITYTGKRYKEDIEINKTYQSTTEKYIKNKEKYYRENNGQYEEITPTTIFDKVSEKYIQLSEVKTLISKAILNHETKYSTGKKEYVYDLKVKDIIKSHQDLDTIEITVTEENNTLTIETDITKLLEKENKEIKKCFITYKYENIGNIEQFNNINGTEEKNE